MSRTKLGMALVLGLAIVSTGCCIDRVYRGGDCALGCDAWADGGCGSCGGGYAGPTPGQLARGKLACAAGCGDVYWGEWISTPPDDCDPCDGCGNWIGSRCCPPRLFSFLTRQRADSPGLWGYRGDMSACCEHGPGCDSCGDGEMWSDEVITEGAVVPGKSGEPRPATPKAAKPKPDAVPEVAPEGAEQAAPPAAKPMPQPDTQARRSAVKRRGGTPTPALQPVPARPRTVSATTR